MKRRQFLGGLAAASLGGLGAWGTWQASQPDPFRLPPGELLGMDVSLGHRLRQPDFPAVSGPSRHTPLLIVGAGIAGLSAAWQLDKAGRDDFLLLELEHQAGGNSRSGENAVSAYPWGAHYLPLPGSEAYFVRELLGELGGIQGDPHAARPLYEETLLCHAPHERLFKEGIWEEGLLPRIGIDRTEKAQYQQFFARMAEYRQARDKQGRRAFALPRFHASPDPAWQALDRLSMYDWLMQAGFDSPNLHTYVNYTCRDDYGTDYRRTSAWAGIHYFACRNGEAANAGNNDGGGESVLTTPGGNGWLVKALAARAGSRLQTRAAVYRLNREKQGFVAEVWDASQQQASRIHAQNVIWSAPLFLLPQVVEGLPQAWHQALAPMVRAPWLVANLTLSALPAPGAGASLAWDNVLHDPSGELGLGYIVATHQQIRMRPQATVLTWYHALSALPPAQARQQLLAYSHADWARRILAELSAVHHDLPARVTRLDIFRHGHAMTSPLPGQMWDGRCSRLMQAWDGLHLAHSDMGQLSLFEEAQFWGVRAAWRVLHPGRELPLITA